MALDATGTPDAHEDLWQLIAESARGRVVQVDWIRAHLSWEAAQAAGVNREDWVGNGWADAAAGAEASRLRLPPQVIAARRALGDRAVRAQRVIASVQLAVLRAALADGQRARNWRRWQQGGAAAGGHQRHAGLCVVAQAGSMEAARELEQLPLGLHDPVASATGVAI